MVRDIYILILIVFASFINYLDRSAIPYSIIQIQHDLSITNQQFGYIASAFGLGYLIMMFLAGVFVDKFGSVKVWAVSAVFWSIIIAITGFARNFTELLALRFLLGLAEACHFPALLKTIADWIDPQLRVRSIAIGVLGVPLAFIIGGPFIASLIDTHGWRYMLLILGCYGFVWAAVWSFCFIGKKNPHLNEPGLEHDEKKKIPWKSFFSSSFFLSNCAVGFGFGYVFFFILTWLPGYFQIAHKLNLDQMSLLAIFPWLAGAIIAVLVGMYSDFLHKKTSSLRISRTYPTIVCLLAISLCFLIVSMTRELYVDVLFISIGFGCAFAIMPLIHALNSDLYQVHVGTAQGIMMCFVALAAVISPSIGGFLIQKTGHFQSMLFSASVIPLITAFIAFIFQKEKWARQ